MKENKRCWLMGRVQDKEVKSGGPEEKKRGLNSVKVSVSMRWGCFKRAKSNRARRERGN